jgi:hypothetical protein
MIARPDVPARSSARGSPAGVLTTALGRPFVLPLVVLALCLVAFVGNLANPFFGSDTWPWLASSQAHDPGSVGRLLVSPIMAGTLFASRIAQFYHPLTTLTYVVDVDLFGLNPAAFYATNLLLHLVAVGALYALGRGLGLAPWSAAVGAALFGLHPIAEATVPSIPRRQDLVVGACFISAMSLLARSALGADRPRWGMVAGALALFALALGGKEIAYAGLGVVPFVLLCAPRGGALGRGRFLRRAAAVFVAFLVVEVVGFGLRWWVLGGLGGYYGSEANRGNLSGVVEYFVRPYVDAVLWPMHALLPARLRDWLIAVALGAAVAGVAASRLSGRLAAIVLLGLGWQASFLVLYVAAHNPLDAYLLYVPLAGFALLVAALLEGGWRRLRAGRIPAAATSGMGGRRPSTRARDLGLSLAALGCAFFVLATLWVSPLRVGYPEFADAGFVSERFLAGALPCLADAQGTAQIDGLPHRIDYGTAQSQFVDAFVFDDYSVESVLRLLAPGATAGVEVRSLSEVRQRPAEVVVTCTGDLDHRQVAVTYAPAAASP